MLACGGARDALGDLRADAGRLRLDDGAERRTRLDPAQELLEGRDPLPGKRCPEPPPGVEGLELGEREARDVAVTVARPFDRLVVGHDEYAVGGTPHVVLEVVGAGRAAGRGGRDGVLWRGGTSAAMTAARWAGAPQATCGQ